MKTTLLPTLMAALFIAPTQAATCSAGAGCHACINCNYYKNCAEQGGSCSVFGPRTTTAKYTALQNWPRPLDATEIKRWYDGNRGQDNQAFGGALNIFDAS